MKHNILNSQLNQTNKSELGKETEYDDTYNPKRLFPIPRSIKRKEIGIESDQLTFYGFDCWNHYEVSWLNAKGKPIVATAEIYYDCRSPFIVESKSLKLYFNSFNNSTFDDIAEVEQTVKNDLQNIIGADVTVIIKQLDRPSSQSYYDTFNGVCIDDLDIECDTYTVKPEFLCIDKQQVTEILFSDLLKSNCLVTNQPDWGSVQISYTGTKINHEGLLRYIISFRNHNEFHEQCIERIFIDIMHRCKPNELTVYGRYTRRGGIDINPFRSTSKPTFDGKNIRLLRQ